MVFTSSLLVSLLQERIVNEIHHFVKKTDTLVSNYMIIQFSVPRSVFQIIV